MCAPPLISIGIQNLGLGLEVAIKGPMGGALNYVPPYGQKSYLS